MTATLDSRPTDILDAIRSRRSIGKVSNEMPSREVIQQLLEAATYAPNHKLTQPWHFWVTAGDSRLELGKALAEAQINHQKPTPEMAEMLRQSSAMKVLRSPVIITVTMDPNPAVNIPVWEDLAAAAAATQNMLLAAHALGLAAIWRSGDYCDSPEIRQHYGLSTRGQVVGFVYLGVPEESGIIKPRKNAEEMTTWLGF